MLSMNSAACAELIKFSLAAVIACRTAIAADAASAIGGSLFTT